MKGQLFLGVITGWKMARIYSNYLTKDNVYG